MKAISFLFVALIAAPSAFAAQIVCLKEYPRWQEINGSKLAYQGRGPGVIINTTAGRATWIGMGGFVSVTGELNSRGVKITRLEGSNPTREEITSQSRTGRVLDLKLADRRGGVGLLRVNLDESGNGRASWQHATDSFSREDLAYCTTNLLE